MRPLLLLTPLVLSGCYSMPWDEIPDEEIEALERVRYDTPVGTVSALRSGPSSEFSPEPVRGTQLLYVHGTPGVGESWAEYLIDPVSGLTSVAIDRPGFGESDRRLVAPLEEQARALEPLLAERERTILIGHSLGGPIVAEAAVRYPDSVAGLVIIAGSLDPELEELRWYNWVGYFLWFALPSALRNSNGELWNLDRELQHLGALLPTIRCPVVIIHGTNDTLVPYANVAYMEQQLRGAASVRTITLEGAGHMVIWEDEHEPEIRAAIATIAVAR